MFWFLCLLVRFPITTCPDRMQGDVSPINTDRGPNPSPFVAKQNALDFPEFDFKGSAAHYLLFQDPSRLG